MAGLLPFGTPLSVHTGHHVFAEEKVKRAVTAKETPVERGLPYFGLETAREATDLELITEDTHTLEYLEGMRKRTKQVTEAQ